MDTSNKSVKDNIRKRSQEAAKQVEAGILTQLEQACKEVLSKKKKEDRDIIFTLIMAGACILAVLFAIQSVRDAFNGNPWNDFIMCVIGFPIALIIGGLISILVFGVIGAIYLLLKKRKDDRYNAKIDREVRHLQREAEEKIRQSYEQTAQMTEHQIAAYEAEVRQISKKILTNPNAIAPMKDFLFDKLEQVISRASVDSTIPDISADLTYIVEIEGIKTDSGYYSFRANQYAPLDSDMKCEALAIALGALVDHEMKTQFPNDVFHIRATRKDAEITLYFSAPNPHYIQPTAIF